MAQIKESTAKSPWMNKESTAKSPWMSMQSRDEQRREGKERTRQISARNGM